MMDTPETQTSTDPKAAMAIVASFEGFVNYLYPMLVNTSRQHRVLRDTVIAACFAQYKLFHAAAKSRQVSRLYEADAGLAYLKELLRFMAGPDRKLAAFEKSGDQAARDQFLASWRGHAQWADCRNLLTHLGATQ
jgi:hypothetical protein